MVKLCLEQLNGERCLGVRTHRTFECPSCSYLLRRRLFIGPLAIHPSNLNDDIIYKHFTPQSIGERERDKVEVLFPD